MKVPSSLACTLAVLMVSTAPAALAASAGGTLDAASPVLLSGAFSVEADSPHVLAKSGTGRQPFTVQGTADALHLLYTYANETTVYNPARGTVAFSHETVYGNDTFTFGASSLASARVGSEATAFIMPIEGGRHEVSVVRGYAGTIAAAAFSEVRGHESSGVGGGEERGFRLAHDLVEPHVRLEAMAPAVRVRGDLALVIWDADLDVASSDGRRTFPTGSHRAEVAPNVAERAIANATLLLRGADLVLTGGQEPFVLFGDTLDLALDGAARLADVAGVLDADGDGRYVARNQDFEASGDMTWTLRPSDASTDRVALEGSGEFTRLDLPLETSTFAVTSRALAGLAGGAGVLALLGFGTVVAMRHRDRMPALRRRRAPVDPDAAAEEAVDAIEARDYKRALTALNGALAARADDADLLIDKGFCLQELGDAQGARLAYEAAVLADPGRAEAHYYYARSLCALGMNTTALTHLSRAFALDRRLAEQAGGDRALRNLHDHPQFLSLLGSFRP